MAELCGWRRSPRELVSASKYWENNGNRCANLLFAPIYAPNGQLISITCGRIPMFSKMGIAIVNLGNPLRTCGKRTPRTGTAARRKAPPDRIDH
jgi:hypothetical protein